MNPRHFARCLASVFTLAALLAGAGTARPQGSATAKPPRESADAESQAEMLARYAMPGPAHKLLDRLAGSWQTMTRYWPKPGVDPVESGGVSTRRWILDGRFVMEELDGGNLALAFRGVGLFGFDAFAQKYTSAWVDTMNTSILTNLGAYDKESDSVRFEGQYKDPWTGKTMKEKGILRFLDRDKHVLELFVIEDQGQEHRMLQITYTRRPAKPK